MQLSQIFKKINNHIKCDFDIFKIQKFFDNSNISNNLWIFKAIIFRHMRNNDMIILICKNEDKTFFNKFIKWIQMLNINAKVYIRIFEILMHSIWMKSMQIKNTNKITRIIEVDKQDLSVRDIDYDSVLSSSRRFIWWNRVKRSRNQSASKLCIEPRISNNIEHFSTEASIQARDHDLFIIECALLSVFRTHRIILQKWASYLHR